MGFWCASEKGLSAFEGEKGHELELSEDARGSLQFQETNTNVREVSGLEK